MQKFQESVFSIVKTTNLSPAVFSFLQPSEDITDKTPLGGIFNDTRHGWLALGPKFCVVDLQSGLKIAAKIFGLPYSNSRTIVTSVVELPTPLTDNSKQLIVSLCEDGSSTICVFHINGSRTLRCIQTDVVVTELAVCDELPNGPFTCFDGVIMAGTRSGEVFVFDLNRAGLIQALKDISQGCEHLKQSENNPSNITFLPLNALQHIEEQRELALENNDHLAILLNESSMVERQYIFRNPDGSVRMKAKREHVRVTVLQYIPQLGSLAVGYNFGAFQLWNLLTLELEYTSQVNLECMPVTHFGFQEPCDDPRAFCYLWVVYSAIDRFEEEEFPLAVMYSLTYHGKRMLSDTNTNVVCLYQEFSIASIRFQVELTAMEDAGHLLGGKCVSCNTYSINSTLGSEGEDSMLNICQLVWECWGETANETQYGMLLFDLDQWYKDQMPETCRLQSNAFMSATWCPPLAGARALAARLAPASVAAYAHCTRLEEHFYPNALQYRCICLTTSEASVLGTVGIQRQLISSLDSTGPTALLDPTRLYRACLAAGLSPLYTYHHGRETTQEEQRKFLLSVALEARLSRFLKRCAHDWAIGSHTGAGCTLTFLVDWCWQRAIELKENAKELTAPLFSSAALPDRNVVRCLEHCVQQLTQLTGLLDAVLTKCCNLVVPDALSEMEEKYKGIGTVSLYFQVVQWFLRVGLLPERHDGRHAAPYPAAQLRAIYNKRRLKLQRLQDNSPVNDEPSKSCSLLYIDQLIENEFGGERVHQMWMAGGSSCGGLYPAPSLYALLRLYLLPDVAEEHKHSLVLYLLVDYSVLYDKVGYEAVIRRLMQFPTMFGLSNTAIKATQAFWHLDHRDFDFALDQLQCLTGNTLSEWQHTVVLSSLLAQKKTQAALQYLHVRKPAPIQIKDESSFSRVNDHDKLEDWQSCCSLYLARELVFEALDVVRMCVQNAASLDEKTRVLNFFFKGCRNTGQLSKILQVTLLPLEEEVFIKYLQNCNEPQTSDILVMYFLQHARYIEAEQYNNKLRHSKSRSKDPTGSVESLADMLDREGARDTIVEVACSFLPAVTSSVRDFALSEKDFEPHVITAKPLSVFVQARSPKNTFTYKSSFIQDTIENASETWMNKPKMRRGLKRALNIEETPFICTPKLNRSRSIYTDHTTESTPSKRAKLDFSSSPKTPKFGSATKFNYKISKQLSVLLDMPEVQSPECKLYIERSAAGTPHSILKTRRSDMDRDAPSPADSRYLDSDDDLDSCSNHTHYSDSTNKHLRFTIPTASENRSTPSPPTAAASPFLIQHKDVIVKEEFIKKERDEDTAYTSDSHAIDESHPLESPAKKLATEEALLKSRKSYKDTVKSRRSLSISVNSSLSDDPNTSIESIADIPITLINPRYSGEKRRDLQKQATEREVSVIEMQVSEVIERDFLEVPVPKTPKGRRGIRVSGGDSPLMNRSRSRTPERAASPLTPLAGRRSRTPDLSPTLPTIPEAPRLEQDSAPHPERTLASATWRLSRSRTPERMDKAVLESPRLEAITESPTKSSKTDSSGSPSRRSLRSRSRTLEKMDKAVLESPMSPTQSSNTDSSGSPSRRSLRSRSRTPEKMDKAVLESPRSPTQSSNTDSSGSPSRRSLRSRSRTPEKMDKAVLESPRSPTPSSNTDSSGSPSRRSLRSRSRTTEKMDKAVLESPRSPTPSSNTDSSGSPSRRSLRSRSRTLEKMNKAVLESPRSPTQSSNTDSSGSPSRRSLRSRSRTPERMDKAVLESPKLDTIPESPTPSSNTDSSVSPSRRSLRSRSRTPVRMDKAVLESPRSPTPSSNTDSSGSPSRRSLRSRSRTPDVEIQPEQFRPASPLILRSRSKTPEIVMSPKGEHSTRSKKSLPLSRIVLEANAFAKSKMNIDQTEPETEASESAIECTPMKTIKQVPSLMDVTLSPIVNKSVLQSSTDSTLSETVDNTTKLEDKSIIELGLKPLPAFSTIHETLYAKSVLHSYQSSIADSSQSMEESGTKYEETAPNESLKSLPGFSTINEMGVKSVLNSYESSIAETSQSMQEDKETKTLDENVSKHYTFTETVEINIEKSVLKSYESSMAESSRDASMSNAKETNDSALKNISLITNDSDVEMKDEEMVWKTNIDSQATASVIQKEKEKIVDIEREINELEGDMTDDDTDGDESNSGDEDIVIPEVVPSNEENSDEAANESSGSDEEIISIGTDTDSDSSSSSNQALRIDEDRTSPEENKPEEKEDKQTSTEVIDQVDIETSANETAVAVASIVETGQRDPLDYEQLSILTDDNSVVQSEKSYVNLNYSDEKRFAVSEDKESSEDVPMETEPAVQMAITVQEIATTVDNKAVEAPISKDIDIVDSVASTDNVMHVEETIQTEIAAIEETQPIDYRRKDNAIEETQPIDYRRKDDAIEETQPIDYRRNDDAIEENQPIVDRRQDNAMEEDQPIDYRRKDDAIEESQPIVDRRQDDAIEETQPIDYRRNDDAIEENQLIVDRRQDDAVEENQPIVHRRKHDAIENYQPIVVIDRLKDERAEKTQKPSVEEKKEPEIESIDQDTENQFTFSEPEPTNSKVDETKQPSVEEEIHTEYTDQFTENLPEPLPSYSTVNENEPEIDSDAKSESAIQDIEESYKPAARRKKRVKSKKSPKKSSNKSMTETIYETIEEPSTPVTRKRTQSDASNKSIEPELKTPENEVTTTRRRTKTPKSTEVRKIITRRASKEISEKSDDSKEVLDDSIASTPKRRSARSRSQNVDYIESVASASESTKGETAEDAGVKPALVRKGRKSILNTKPDLSVIPEMIAEEASKDTEDIIKDYSSSRRLTRHQKAVLESWLEPSPVARPPPSPVPRPLSRARRASTVSRASDISRASDVSRDDDDASSIASGFDVQPIDRISLSSKQDSEGSPDPDETLCGSPDSFASEMNRQRRARANQARAASESVTTPKPIKLHLRRRASVEWSVRNPDSDSPVPEVMSERGRRASFNKACEALHTPKGRRVSTDSRKDAESPQELLTSPEAAATPSRRARRLASAQSNSSQTKESGKRSKKRH